MRFLVLLAVFGWASSILAQPPASKIDPPEPDGKVLADALSDLLVRTNLRFRSRS